MAYIVIGYVIAFAAHTQPNWREFCARIGAAAACDGAKIMGADIAAATSRFLEHDQGRVIGF